VTFIEASTTYNHFSTPIHFSRRCLFIWKPCIHMCYKAKVSATYLKQLLRALEERSSRTVTTRYKYCYCIHLHYCQQRLFTCIVIHL